MSASRHPFRSKPYDGKSIIGDGLNQLSVFPFSLVQREAWADCNGYVSASMDCWASKEFTFSRLSVGSGIEIDVYNLHFDAGGSMKDDAVRRSNIEQLLRSVQAAFALPVEKPTAGTSARTGFCSARETIFAWMCLAGRFPLHLLTIMATPLAIMHRSRSPISGSLSLIRPPLIYRLVMLVNGYWPSAPRGASECALEWRGPAQIALNPRFYHHYNRYSDNLVKNTHWSHWEDLKEFYGVNKAGFAL